jgi:hypothetical protein
LHLKNIIKQSIQEAILPMKKSISDAVDPTLARIKSLILEQSKEGDVVIVAGIGNTMGVAQ